MDFLANFYQLHSRRQIAKIAKVSERTAQRWLSGKSKPSKATLKLLMLHDHGRIMPDNWAKNFRFNGNFLDIGHNKNLAAEQVGWYFYSIKLWYLMLDRLPQIEARLDAMMKVCPPAEVINLQAYKDEITRIKNRPFALPDNHIEMYDLPAKSLNRVHGC